MARATTTRVLIRLRGVYPRGWDATSVGNLCTQADYKIDGHTYPDTIGTTNICIEIAVDVVLRMMRQADMLGRSSGASTGEGVTYPDHVVLTDEIKQRISKQLNLVITTIDMME